MNMPNPQNVRARQNIAQRAYVKGQNALLERGSWSRGGWRNYGAFYLPKYGGSGSVATMGGRGTIVGP